MPTGGNPITTGINRKLVIQFQRDDGRAPTGRQPDHLCSIVAPFEMPRPLLKTRIEKPDSAICHQIISMRLNAFANIARAAGEAKIPLLIRASASIWDDVFNLQFPRYQALGAETVFAAIPCCFTCTKLNFDWNGFPGHDSNGSIRPRLTASAIPCAFRTRPS